MQITFLNGEQAILYINKNAVQNTRGAPCTSLNTQQLLKDKRHVQKTNSYPTGFM